MRHRESNVEVYSLWGIKKIKNFRLNKTKMMQILIFMIKDPDKLIVNNSHHLKNKEILTMKMGMIKIKIY